MCPANPACKRFVAFLFKNCIVKPRMYRPGSAVYITSEVMDEILAALVALVHWRLVLSTLGSIALAVALSNIIPLFTAAYCITLVIFGFTFGLVWQGRTDSGLSLTEKTEDPEISKPVAFIGLAFIGLVAGGLLGELFGSMVGGAIALSVCAGIVALWFRLTRRRISLRSFVFSLLSLLIGYSILLALAA